MTNTTHSKQGARDVGRPTRRVITEPPQRHNCSPPLTRLFLRYLLRCLRRQPESFRSHPVLGTPTPTANYRRRRRWALFCARSRRKRAALAGWWPTRRLACPPLSRCALSVRMCDWNRWRRNAILLNGCPPSLFEDDTRYTTDNAAMR